MIVDTSTTRKPRSREFLIVVRLFLFAIVSIALVKLKLPSIMTASLKIARIGSITMANNKTKIVK